MRKALIALALLLLFAQGASRSERRTRQGRSGMTPSGPFGMIRIFIGIIAIITAMDGITIGETAMTEIHTQEHQDSSMMDEAIAQAFVAARRKRATEHQSRLLKAWELVADHALGLNGDGRATS